MIPRVDLHPVYIAEVGHLDQPTLQSAIDVALDLTLALRKLSLVEDPRQRRRVALVCLSLLIDQGARFEHCRQIIESVVSEALTPGERYQIAELCTRVGQTHKQQQEFEAAVEIYRRGLQLIDGLPARITTATLCHNLGVALEQWGKYEEAAVAFTDSAALEQRLGRTSYVAEEEARAASNREKAHIDGGGHALGLLASGVNARQAGRMGDALQCFLEARQHVYRSADTDLIVLVATNIAGIYFYQGEYSQAREICIEALDTIDENSIGGVRVRLRLATIRSAERDSLAEGEFRAVLALASLHNWTEEIDEAEYGLSQLAIEAGDYEGAHSLLDRVLARRMAAHEDAGRPRLQLGNVLNQIGFVAAKQGRIDEAVKYHREALAVRRGHDLRGCAESSHSLGYLGERIGQRRQALAHYTQTIRYYEAIRRAISEGDEARASFQELVGDCYDDAARLACSLGRGAIAWYALQRRQNRTLLDGLTRAPATKPDSVPTDLFEWEGTLLDRLRLGHVDRLTFHDLLRQLTGVHSRIRNLAPDYTRWRTGEPPGTKTLLQWLEKRGNGSAFLELCEFHRRVDDAGWRMELVGVCASQGGTLKTFSAAAPVAGRRPAAQDLDGLAAAVETVASAIGEVVGGPGPAFVVTHGPLANVPLHVLVVKGKPLVEWQPVRYLPHSGFLASDDWLPPIRVETVSVLGDSDGGLPGAHREALRVASVFAVEPMLGNAVTRSAIATALATADVVHVAGHAFFEAGNPNGSGLVASDGVFTAEDVGRSVIRAGVVVLNACESGTQGRGIGNELQGFVRALLLGGVRHIVCTLDTVDDEAAAEFAEHLYHQFKAPATGDVVDVVAAVWQSQLALARRYAKRPELWRSFILVG